MAFFLKTSFFDLTLILLTFSIITDNFIYIKRKLMKLKNGIIASLAIFLILGCNGGDKIKKEQQSDQNTSTANIDNIKKKYYDTPISLKLINDKEFTLKMREDNNIEVIQEQGDKKATLFVFFATWCPPCKVEIPHLNNLAEKFRKDLNIIGISLENKSIEEIKEFAKSYNIKYDIAVGEANFILEKAVGGILGLPSSILYKADGSYFNGYVGLVHEEILESDISKAIR